MLRAHLMFGLLGLVPAPDLGPGGRDAAPKTNEANEAHETSVHQTSSHPIQTPVRQTSCTSCHGGVGGIGGVGGVGGSNRERTPPGGICSRPSLQAQKDEKRFLEWDAMVRSGVRFVNRYGSKDRFDTDVDLDNGVRLMDAELRGRFLDNNPFLDSFRFEANDIGDPYERVKGVLEKNGLYKAEGSFTKNVYKYRASGDYHRVDTEAKDTAFDLSFDITDEFTVFGSWQRLNQNSFWLVQRVGNRNLVPLTFVNNVQSPRQLDQDLLEAGLSGNIDGWGFTLAGDYLTQDDENRWFFSQNSPVNPAFQESEDTASTATLRGPGGRLNISKSFEGLDLSANLRVLDLDRRIVTNGRSTGFDTDAFTTNTNGFSHGRATTWIVDTSAVFELSDELTFDTDFRWLDYDERMFINQTEVTVIPSSGFTSTINTDLNQHTTQRSWDIAGAFDWQAHEALRLTFGYGWAQEDIRVPDLTPGDNDFDSGTVKNHGLLTGFDWRPDKRWRVDFEWRDFGTSGGSVTEIDERQGRHIRGRVRYKTEKWWVTASALDKNAKNHVSNYRADSDSYTVTAGVSPHDALNLYGTYAYVRNKNRTRTNFFFDPDPTPRVTEVGYQGSSDVFYFGATVKPSDRVTWQTDFAYTKATGDFDLDLLDWHVDVALRVTKRGFLGVDVRQVDYEEDGPDNYGAWLVFIYWRQEFTGRH